MDDLQSRDREHLEARREMREFILGQPDDIKDLYYRTITLAEHEAARHAVLKIQQPPSIKGKDDEQA